jgi:gamma-glutamyltranspeptidase/glutathione hydrolase
MFQDDPLRGSSMSPAMIFGPDGRPLVAFGSPGGASIINSVFNVTRNLIDHGMTVQDAINAPRVSVTSAGGAATMEPGFRSQPSMRSGRSITVTTPGGEIGSVQAVVVDQHTGKQYGGADSRREGTVIGLPRPRGSNSLTRRTPEVDVPTPDGD